LLVGRGYSLIDSSLSLFIWRMTEFGRRVMLGIFFFIFLN